MQLSPECKDLLNRIFVIDATKRVTIEQIEAHPWYLKPLPPKYQVVLDRLAKEQEGVDARMARLKKCEVSRGRGPPREWDSRCPQQGEEWRAGAEDAEAAPPTHSAACCTQPRRTAEPAALRGCTCMLRPFSLCPAVCPPTQQRVPGPHASSSPHTPTCPQSAIEARNKALERMVEEATHLPPPGTEPPLQRIDLREQAVTMGFVPSAAAGSPETAAPAPAAGEPAAASG